ncbi:MAG: hypothetical protein EHM55_04705 [Acidobacteria bacterium]|nr:MAG: hypothetical protein EHM55_04705 [Acidobacteriota bacterium]
MFSSSRLARLAGLSFLAVGTTALVGAQEGARATRLEVLLTTATALSESARSSMTEEAGAIWREHGVIVDWLPTAAVRTVAPHRLRVLVVDQRPPNPESDRQFSVGELIRPSGSHPVALVSIESARRLVSSLRGRAGYELIAVDERRLGVVLGRALAHEIGHYLLDTHTHARIGLMRPQFSALEFTDPRDGIFALDADAAAWLRRRDVEKFAYAHR